MRSSINGKLWRGRSIGGRIAITAGAFAVLVSALALGVSAAAARGSKAAPLTVWIDTSRVPYQKAYMAAHPHANIHWVLYNGNQNGTGVLQSKFALWNRTGWPSNAPDVIFDTQNYDAVQLATPPYNDLLDLTKYVPKKVLESFAGSSLQAACETARRVICLRNDSAAEVLWVNPALFDQFFPGQTPPTTWQQLLSDSQTLQAKHPGYISGDIGDQFDEDFILWSNACPVNQVTKVGSITINPLSPNCTSIAKMIDNAGVAGKSWTTTGVFTSGFDAKKVVMMVGPLWYGTAVFQNGAANGVPTGTVAAYPPLIATNGQHITGALGGGLWLVTSHSKQPAAAAALAEYMATSPKIQTPSVDAGLPDYVPAQPAYLQSLDKVFAKPTVTEASWKLAAASVWQGWSPVPWSVDAAWGSTALPNLTANPPASFAAQLEPFGIALANQARLAGYSVTSPDKKVSQP